jgi:hypothetical protein
MFVSHDGDRAYIVPSDLTILKSLQGKRKFEKTMEGWMRGQVAYYKYLRGGELHGLDPRVNHSSIP